MALSLSSGRRRWACRAARRGGKGWAGCRHFHVHYHVPRQVWAFSPLKLTARFSLLPYLLILPVLFFAVLAFLVCFGWFTLVYFVSSLWSKENDHEVCVSRSTDCGNDGGEPRGEDEREERAMKRATEQAGDSSPSEVCVETREIKEVFEDGFSEESRHMSMMASPGICIGDKEQADEEKIVTEVMMFETNKKEQNPFAELDGCSDKHQQVMEPPFDCFLEDHNTREFSTSLYAVKLLDVPYGDEFVANRMELTVLSSLEILEFIDKHDAAQKVVEVNGADSDFEIPEASSSDDSSHHGLGDEQRKDIKQEQSTTELSVNCVDNRLPDGILDEWQETENLAIHRNKKLTEDDSMEEDRKQIVSISGEAQDSLCEMAGLPLDSVCENESENVAASNTPFHQAIHDQDGEFKQELIKNKIVESSTSASAVCDFADNHWSIIEQHDGFESEDCEVENEDRDGNCTFTGASCRLPLIRRSPTQWWNLCGVLDAFAGGED